MRPQRLLIGMAAIAAALAIGACQSPSTSSPTSSASASHSAATQSAKPAVAQFKQFAGKWEAVCGGDAFDTITIKADGTGALVNTDLGPAAGPPVGDTTYAFHLVQADKQTQLIYDRITGPHADSGGAKVGDHESVRLSKGRQVLLIGPGESAQRFSRVGSHIDC